MPHAVPAVLTIAGSDPSGGAGIQADLKTFTAHGAFGMSVVTSLTAQNTCGVRAVHVPPAWFLREQLEALSDDVRIDAVKIGMLAQVEVVDVVADWLSVHRPTHVVLDPVMVARSGQRLLQPDAVQSLRERLFGVVDLVTPNLPELADLLGVPQADHWPGAVDQARALADATEVRVLVKGGHLGGPQSPDALVEPDGRVHQLAGARIDTADTHGTGCTLSSAVVALRSSRPDWLSAVRDAKAWVAGAISAGRALAIGQGPGPVNHLHALAPSTVRSFTDQVWQDTAPLRRAIDDLPFLRGLADGSLPGLAFEEYLRQDGLYLQQYSRALASLAVLAPTGEEQLLWAESAQQALVVERALHASWLAAADVRPGRHEQPVASAVCTAYTSYLLAVAQRGDYAELVAAVLPCFWVYADVGERLLEETRARPRHPYRRWIDQYGDPAFAARTLRVRQLADRLAEGLAGDGRRRMAEAFSTATRYEWMFWDAPWRGEHWPV